MEEVTDLELFLRLRRLTPPQRTRLMARFPFLTSGGAVPEPLAIFTHIMTTCGVATLARLIEEAEASPTPTGGPPPPPVPRPSSRPVILFLAASPTETDRLALDNECAAIEEVFHASKARDRFEFRSKWAVTIDRMMAHLDLLTPTVIHFSCHGSLGAGSEAEAKERGGDPPDRDIQTPASAGLYLEGEGRQPQHVSACDLANMIGSAATSVRVVVLNACFSEGLAEALLAKLERCCVVGMNGPIGDDAACSFAVGFYRALLNGRSISDAVAQANTTVAAKRLPSTPVAVCRSNAGYSADETIL